MDKLKLDDMLMYKFLSGVRYSPDGKQAAFMVHRMDRAKDCYLSDIWLYDCGGGECKRLTSSGSAKDFMWIGRDKVMFSDCRSLKGKKAANMEEWTEYYTISTGGGEAVPYMAVPAEVKSILPLGVGRWAVLAAYDGQCPNPAAFAGSEKKAAISLRRERDQFELFDEIPFWQDGGSFASKKRTRLYIYDRHERTMLPVTDELTDVSHMCVKNRSILYVAKRYDSVMPVTEGIYEYSAATGATQTLIDSSLYHVFFAEYVGQEIIFAGTDMKRFGTEENPFFYSVKDGEVALIAENEYNIGGSGGSDCFWGHNEDVRVSGGSLYFTSTEHTHMYIKKLCADGSIVKLNQGDGSVHGFDVYDGNVLFVGMRGLCLQELYALEGGSVRKLSSLNQSLKSKTLSTPEPLNISFGGDEVEGFVLKPVGFDRNESYPAILTVHGGPKSIYSAVFHHAMQYWAACGYFVFYLNPKGSEGRGNAYADVRGRYGKEDYEQIMAFTDKVLEVYPQIDGERLGVTGISYGGFMTNWIIGHTDRFRCAISEMSISCHISDICAGDIGYWFTVDQMQADPWTDANFLWQSSPLKYADRVKTPTMFIQGERDYRCWLTEGLQMFTALKYHGVEAILWLIKGASHLVSWEGLPSQRIGRLERIMEWFDSHLK